MHQVQDHKREYRHPPCCLLQVWSLSRNCDTYHIHLVSRACFEPFVLTKFRRCLDPTINASPTGRKKALKASGNVMVGHSGGLGSAILLDILTRIYLSRGTINGTTEKGGSSHPRNEPVWKTAYICHVDVSETLPEVCYAQPFFRRQEISCPCIQSEKYSHDDIQSLHQHQCPDIQFLSVRLEDAFDWKWWRSINHSLINDTEHASLSLDGGRYWLQPLIVFFSILSRDG